MIQIANCCPLASCFLGKDVGESILHFSEFCRGCIVKTAENFYEIIHVIKTALLSNIINRHRTWFQQTFGFFDTQRKQIFKRRHPEYSMKFMRKSTDTHIGFFCKIGQSVMFFRMFLHFIDNRQNSVVEFGIGFHFKHFFGWRTQNFQKQFQQKAPAKYFIPFIFLFQFII